MKLRLSALAALFALAVGPPAFAAEPQTYQGTVTLPTGVQARGAVQYSDCTPYHLANGSAATNNSTLASVAARTLCKLVALNTTATVYYLKVYDLAAAPTCSSATGLIHVYPIPASASGNGYVITDGAPGERLTNGFAFCVTGGGSDTDNSSAATGVYIEGSYR